MVTAERGADPKNTFLTTPEVMKRYRWCRTRAYEYTAAARRLPSAHRWGVPSRHPDCLGAAPPCEARLAGGAVHGRTGDRRLGERQSGISRQASGWTASERGRVMATANGALLMSGKERRHGGGARPWRAHLYAHPPDSMSMTNSGRPAHPARPCTGAPCHALDPWSPTRACRYWKARNSAIDHQLPEVSVRVILM